MSEQDKTLALMVYETWLLNGCSLEALPPRNLRNWVDKQLGRRMSWAIANTIEDAWRSRAQQEARQ